MKKIIPLLLFFLSFGAIVKAQSNVLVVADFDKGRQPTNLGEDFGTWDGFPNDATQSCRMSFSGDDALGQKDGKSIRLDYDVDSTNAAYNGFWMKIGEARIENFDTFSFYVKGSSEKGFTPKIRIELKDKKQGKASFSVDNITDQWQKISLTVDARSLGPKQKKPFAEFVIIFDDVSSRPKSGEIFIDQIEFSKSM